MSGARKYSYCKSFFSLIFIHALGILNAKIRTLYLYVRKEEGNLGLMAQKLHEGYTAPNNCYVCKNLKSLSKRIFENNTGAKLVKKVLNEVIETNFF